MEYALYGANYFFIDVTHLIVKYFNNETGQLCLPAGFNMNQLFGDPAPTVIKTLMVSISGTKYEMDENICLHDVKIVPEHKINTDIRQIFGNVTKIYCIANEQFEPVRYKRLNDMFTKHNVQHTLIKYMCSSWKHLMSDEIMDNYVTSKDFVLRYRNTRMEKNEISLFINNIDILKDIKNSYTDGVFLILESDVIEGPQFNMMPEVMKLALDNIDKWDLMYIGTAPIPFRRPYREVTFTQNHPFIHIYEGTELKYTDAYLWTYKAVLIYLQYISDNFDFKVPYDHYMEQFYMEAPVKFCWVHSPTLLIQTSVIHEDVSTIQFDTS